MSAIRAITVCLLVSFVWSCTPLVSPEQAQRDFLLQTGFHPMEGVPAEENWLTKNYRGYDILFRPQMGDVWGRYAARMAIGEIGRNSNRLGQFLSGSYEHVGTVVGSPLDRLLSRVIGQPLTFYIVVKHNKPNAPRLDVLSDFSTVSPDDPLPKYRYVGFNAGNIYTSNPQFAEKILSHPELVEKLSNLRSQYIRVDELGTSFIFAGSERDWSAEIRERDGYAPLINEIVDVLTEISDLIPQ